MTSEELYDEYCVDNKARDRHDLDNPRPKKKKNWYFTFGSGQAFPNGYVKISAESSEIARQEMFNRFGSNWCWHYAEKEFLPQIEKYNLHEVKQFKIK